MRKNITAALCTVVGVLSALHHRERSGEGQMVDVAMLDCQVGILENALARYFVSGDVPGRLGTRHPSITPFQAFDTADGSVVLAIGNDRLWEHFCHTVGRDELAADARFATNALRTQNVAEILPIMAELLRSRPTAWWLSEMEAAGIPCGPINTIDRLAADPQVAAREMIQEVLDPAAGPMRMAGVPIKLSATPGAIAGPAPALGQHTDEILSQYLGLDAAAVARLREAGVV